MRDELRLAAEAATPGEWWVFSDDGSHHVIAHWLLLEENVGW